MRMKAICTYASERMSTLNALLFVFFLCFVVVFVCFGGLVLFVVVFALVLLGWFIEIV